MSVAMNTTAFGIISALPCLVGYTFLMEKTNELIDEINENVARLFRYMTSAR
ncbi:MAG: MotA/TolQ/ExbB proton channel family protein [candidate division KSB1 bacterium]|nr:MotA/TolQ/ExbB proton channel family protein [candidate division KSB1 bacterium]